MQPRRCVPQSARCMYPIKRGSLTSSRDQRPYPLRLKRCPSYTEFRIPGLPLILPGYHWPLVVLAVDCPDGWCAPTLGSLCVTLMAEPEEGPARQNLAELIARPHISPQCYAFNSSRFAGASTCRDLHHRVSYAEHLAKSVSQNQGRLSNVACDCHGVPWFGGPRMDTVHTCNPTQCLSMKK